MAPRCQPRSTPPSTEASHWNRAIIHIAPSGCYLLKYYNVASHTSESEFFDGAPFLFIVPRLCLPSGVFLVEKVYICIYEFYIYIYIVCFQNTSQSGTITNIEKLFKIVQKLFKIVQKLFKIVQKLFKIVQQLFKIVQNCLKLFNNCFKLFKNCLKLFKNCLQIAVISSIFLKNVFNS